VSFAIEKTHHEALAIENNMLAELGAARSKDGYQALAMECLCRREDQ
jgi:hypothetical protein